MFFFSDNKVSPFVCEGRVGASEGNSGVAAIEKYLAIEAFEGGGEAGAGVKIDGDFGLAEAEAELGAELLRAGNKSAPHRAIDVGRKNILGIGHWQGVPWQEGRIIASYAIRRQRRIRKPG